MILWLSMVLANENRRIVKSETECSKWSLFSRLSSDKHQSLQILKKVKFFLGICYIQQVYILPSFRVLAYMVLSLFSPGSDVNFISIVLFNILKNRPGCLFIRTFFTEEFLYPLA